MHWHFSETEEGIRRQKLGELIPKIIPLFKPHAKYFFISMTLLVFITLSQLAGPIIIRHIIDFSLAKKDVTDLLLSGLILIGIIVAGAGLGYYQAITLFTLGIGILTDLKGKLFQHVLYLGLDFHEKHPPGKLLSRVESDTETLKELFSDVAVNLLRNIVLFIGIITVLLISNFKIAAYILILMPFLFTCLFYFLRFISKFWREVRARVGVVLGYVTEYVQGNEVITQFNYQPKARIRMKEINQAKYRVDVPAQFFEYSFWGFFHYSEVVAIIIVIFIGVKQVYAGTLTIGELIMFFMYIQQIFMPIIQLSEQLNFIQRGLISVERVFGILETKSNIEDGNRSAAELKFENEITFENVWFAYEEENWILKGLNFKVRKGEKLAIVGSSGGGKSTIINVLLRFYDPQKGRVMIDGVDIREYPIQAWRALIGLVLQEIYLFPGTIADNIKVFEESIDLKRVETVASIVKADSYIEKLPLSYESELSERGSNLSVGERQLLSFARALAFDPPILMLDEATSSVDPHTERLVQEALDRLMVGRTAIIVAHRLSTIIHANNIILVNNGEIEEEGKHEELLKLNGMYTKLCKLQFGEKVVSNFETH